MPRKATAPESNRISVYLSKTSYLRLAGSISQGVERAGTRSPGWRPWLAKCRCRAALRASSRVTSGVRLRESRVAPRASGFPIGFVAIRYSTREGIAYALRRLADAKITLEGAADHGVSEALYLRYPDEIGVELYWDRPRELWPRDTEGKIRMFTKKLDLNDLS